MIGRTISHYEIVTQIGAGGMGTVYRARDSLSGRPVALKLLRPTSTADAAQRFTREAQVLATLQVWDHMIHVFQPFPAQLPLK